MDFIIYASRYALPFLTVFLISMCVSTLWLGHPKEKTYAYLINKNDGRIYEISMWETSIGRGRYCDIVLDDDTVSSSHAVITRRIDGWYICDLFSKKGIRVNETKVEKRCQIQNGNTIKIGKTVFRFEIVDDPVQTESKRARKAQMKAMKKEQKQSRNVQRTRTRAQGQTVNTGRTPAAKKASLPQNTPTFESFYNVPSQQRQTAHPSSQRTYGLTNDSRVIAFRSPKHGESRKFDADKTITIGSSERADIKIKEPGVLGVHARIVHYKEGWAIEKIIDSAIYIGGKKIAQRKLLSDGNVITLGSATIIYRQQ